ncbi:hypothetical protein J4526_01855 [Desulfurococcaceae archaeon MEX13E-LK6-19]|nr:hypothetical protein J4526_01855 [Desulfurococcaceae archaeon MEX13E-LK6-19]
MGTAPSSTGTQVIFSSKSVPRRKIGPRVRVDVIAEFKKLVELTGRDFEELVEEAMIEYLRKHGIRIDGSEPEPVEDINIV